LQRPVRQGHSRSQALFDAVDNGFVDAELHLHLGEIGHQQQHLILVNGRTFGDRRRLPFRGIGVNYQTGTFRSNGAMLNLHRGKIPLGLLWEERIVAKNGALRHGVKRA